jgi:hypothetical protein
MKLAVIVHGPFGFEDHSLFRVDGNQDIPGTIARSGRMGDKIGIDPLDRIAGMRGDFCRQKPEFFHLDLDGGGARHTRHSDEKECAEYRATLYESQPTASFEFRCDVFSMLFVALKNL